MSICEIPIADAGEFLRGQRHCRQGLPHQDNQHPDYDRGYRTEYEWGEVQSALTQQQEAH